MVLRTGLLCLMAAACGHAAWENISGDLGNLQVRSMFTYVDTLMVGTADGIFRSADHGDTWTDISGDIGSRVINDIRGGGGPRVIWAATGDGVYYTEDQASYQSGNLSGLPSSEANYYWFGDDVDGTRDWAVGTSGGLVAGPELDGPWTDYSSGLTGDALAIRDLSGYSDDDEDYSVVATADGVYFSTDHLETWSEGTSGLAGDARAAHRLAVLGSLAMVATDGGLMYTTDHGAHWNAIDDGARYRTVTVSINPVLIIGLGEAGILTTDFINWNAVDMSGLDGGDVTCVAVAPGWVYAGTESGGVFRMALGEVGVENRVPAGPASFTLLPNAPNPFNPTTRLSFQLRSAMNVRLSVHDLAGREVALLLEARQPAGQTSISFDGSALASGIYLATLRAGGATQSRRMLLIK